MKKVLIAGLLGVFAIGMTGCGSGHKCDAYRAADYTQYKKDQTQKIELLQELSEAQK